MGKSKYIFTIILTATFVLWSCGCQVRPIQEVYSKQLSDVKPGMTTDEFRQVMPKAYVAGQNTIGGKQVDAYELRYSQLDEAGITNTQVLWFYFFDKKLMKWGEPNAWPTEPDLIVETRRR